MCNGIKLRRMITSNGRLSAPYQRPISQKHKTGVPLLVNTEICAVKGEIAESTLQEN